MKAEDIRDWDNVEITARLEELREEQFRLRFQGAMMELSLIHISEPTRPY